MVAARESELHLKFVGADGDEFFVATDGACWLWKRATGVRTLVGDDAAPAMAATMLAEPEAARAISAIEFRRHLARSRLALPLSP
jgi:hypothetical protein